MGIKHFKLLIVLFLFCIVMSDLARAESEYIRNNSNNNNVIVFVHGIIGDSDTWRSGNSYWPELLSSDDDFDAANIFVLEYPTKLSSDYSIDELADHMRLVLNVHDIFAHENVSFLVHSMGGLVLRSFLLKNRKAAENTRMAYFFSTPTEGSQIASLARLITKNPHLGKMIPITADSFLADLVRGWRSAKFKFPSYCAYEKRDTYGVRIVTFESAVALCSEALDPVDANHIDIVKPKDKNTTSYLAFKSAFMEIKNNPHTKEIEDLINYYKNRAKIVEDDFLNFEKHVDPEEKKKLSNTDTISSGVVLLRSGLKRKQEFDSLHTM